MQNLEEYPGIRVGAHNIHPLRYVDGTVLIPENKDLLRSLDILEEESRKKELELNRKKIEVVVVNGSNERPQITIIIKGNKLKQKDNFKHFNLIQCKLANLTSTYAFK